MAEIRKPFSRKVLGIGKLVPENQILQKSNIFRRTSWDNTFKINWSFLFDGVSEYFTIPNAALNDLFKSSNDFTLITAFKITNLPTSGNYGLVSNNSGGAFTMSLYYNTTKRLILQTFFAGYPSIQTSAFITANTWYFLVAVIDKTTPANNKMYINGVNDVNSNSLGTFGNNTYDYVLAARNQGGGQYLDGNMGYVAVINRTLSNSEADDIYNSGKPLNPISRFGVDCKYFFNPNNSGSTAQFSVVDSKHSITAVSTNLEDADKVNDTMY